MQDEDDETDEDEGDADDPVVRFIRLILVLVPLTPFRLHDVAVVRHGIGRDDARGAGMQFRILADDCKEGRDGWDATTRDDDVSRSSIGCDGSELFTGF